MLYAVGAVIVGVSLQGCGEASLKETTVAPTAAPSAAPTVAPTEAPPTNTLEVAWKAYYDAMVAAADNESKWDPLFAKYYTEGARYSDLSTNSLNPVPTSAGLSSGKGLKLSTKEQFASTTKDNTVVLANADDSTGELTVLSTFVAYRFATRADYTITFSTYCAEMDGESWKFNYLDYTWKTKGIQQQTAESQEDGGVKVQSAKMDIFKNNTGEMLEGNFDNLQPAWSESAVLEVFYWNGETGTSRKTYTGLTDILGFYKTFIPASVDLDSNLPAFKYDDLCPSTFKTFLKPAASSTSFLFERRVSFGSGDLITKDYIVSHGLKPEAGEALNTRWQVV